MKLCNASTAVHGRQSEFPITVIAEIYPTLNDVEFQSLYLSKLAIHIFNEIV